MKELVLLYRIEYKNVKSVISCDILRCALLKIARMRPTDIKNISDIRISDIGLDIESDFENVTSGRGLYTITALKIVPKFTAGVTRRFSIRRISIYGAISISAARLVSAGFLATIRPVIICGALIACCSCSTLESTMGAALAQLSHAITGGEETKQGKGGSFGQGRDLSSEFFRQLLQSVTPGETQQSMLRIWPLSQKISNNSNLGGAVGFGLGKNGTLYVIGADGRMAKVISTGVKAPVAGALSLRSGSLAVSDIGRVRVFDLISERQTRELTKLRTRVNSLDFDSAGEALLLGGTDAHVYQWNFSVKPESFRQEEKSLQRYIGHATVVSQVLFHPRERIFFSSDWSGKVSAWQRYDSDSFEGEYIKNATAGRPFTAERLRANAEFVAEGNVERLECSGDGELLVVASDKGELSLLMVRGFKPLAKVLAHRGLIYDIAFSADGRTILTIGRDDRLKLWRVESLDLESIDPTKAEIVLDRMLEVPGANRVALAADDQIIIGFKNGDVRMVARDQLLPIPESGT